MRWHVAAPFALILAAVSLPGQQTEAQRELEQQARKMREHVQEGTKMIRTHARVQIRLKNGNRMRGIVKDSNLVERVDGYRFVQAEISQAGAGIRLWYHDNKNSFVFLPFLDVAEYKVQERLSSEQLLAIEEQVIQEERRREEEKARLRGLEPPPAGEGETPETPKTGGEETPPPKPPGEATGAAGSKPAGGDDAKLLDLLREFPPADGWSVERRAQIIQRRVAVHVAPSAQEQRFLDAYGEWQKAVARFVGEEKPAQPAESGRGSGRRK